MLRQTPETVVTEINRLLDDHTESEIADLLNSKGMISGEGKRFNRTMVSNQIQLRSGGSLLQAPGTRHAHFG
jgi:polynucleotide 5'-kinase involved in rRNA processing